VYRHAATLSGKRAPARTPQAADTGPVRQDRAMTDGDLGYVESFGPGLGFAPARAWQAMGSARLSLNGTWKFRYRVILHKGDEKEGRIAESFAAYAKQP
jgi:hypothetical protein